jgi:hypothetical protein
MLYLTTSSMSLPVIFVSFNHFGKKTVISAKAGSEAQNILIQHILRPASAVMK